MSVYLVVGFGVSLKKVSVNGQQGTETSTTPIVWDGVTVEPNSQGNYIEESTKFDPFNHTFIQDYKFHIELPEDENIVKGLSNSSQILASSFNYPDLLSVWNNCSRILVHYIYTTIIRFIKACGGKVEDEVEIDAFDPVDGAKNQVIVKDDNSIYLKITASLEDNPEKSFVMTTPFALLLLHTFKTGNIFTEIQNKLNLPEPSMEDMKEDEEDEDSETDLREGISPEEMLDDEDEDGDLDTDEEEIDAINAKMDEADPHRISKEILEHQ